MKLLFFLLPIDCPIHYVSCQASICSSSGNGAEICGSTSTFDSGSDFSSGSGSGLECVHYKDLCDGVSDCSTDFDETTPLMCKFKGAGTTPTHLVAKGAYLEKY